MKNEGTIYLHCNTYINHCLGLLLDILFGNDKFRSEISWKRHSLHNDCKMYSNNRDIILFYSSDSKINLDDIRVPLDEKHVKKSYIYSDDKGVYMTGPMTGRKDGGCYHYTFRGLKGPWIFPEESMKKMERENRIHFPKKEGGIPRKKIYLHENVGQVLGNIWTDINIVGGNERITYIVKSKFSSFEKIIGNMDEMHIQDKFVCIDI